MKWLYITLSILGVVGFFSLYILVSVYKESNYPFIKYLIPIVGYISLIVFIFGWLKFLKIKKNK